MTPKELVTKVSELTGIPESTVRVHDRNLAEAGMRTRAKRGRGTTNVTPQDAANLLVAVAASQTAKDSAKTVERHKDIADKIAVGISSAWVIGLDLHAPYTISEKTGDLTRQVCFTSRTTTALAASLS